MPTPIGAKKEALRRYLAEDQTWTAFDVVAAVPLGWIFIEHPDGGAAAWRKPPRWALTQSPGDRIRPRVRGGIYPPK